MITNRQLPFRRDSRGAVLIVVLIVCLGLVSLVLLLGHSMVLAYRGADNELAGRQAEMAVEGGAQYAEQVMSNLTQPGAMPDPTTYQYQEVPLGEATFWFIGEPDPSASTNSANPPAFGLIDEASKLNLNQATDTELENLPNMTQDLAEAIVQWRTSGTAATSGGTTSSGSSASSSSSSSSSSSTMKGGLFESVEELAQVNGGTDLLMLYGNDTNLNHVLDPSEAAGGASSFAPGLLEYLTVFSRIPNTTPSGAQRLNVTVTSGSLTSLLTSTFGTDRGGQIAAALRTGGAVKSVLEFYMKSGMTDAEFAEVSGSLCQTTGPYTYGLINVNTASQTVLECVPGITPTMASQIVSTRESQSEAQTSGTSTGPPNLAWVAPILTGSAATAAGPYLTAETYQVTADVAAVGRHGRGYRRCLFVIDTSTGTPQIVYRRDLSSLGWALGAQERQYLAQEEQQQQGQQKK